MSAINLGTPAYSFAPELFNGSYVPKATLGFTKTALNEIDNISQMALFAWPEQRITSSFEIATAGSAKADVSSSAVDYYFRQEAYGGRVWNNSPSVRLPAFTFPKPNSATASYSAADQKVTFSWKMDPVY